MSIPAYDEYEFPLPAHDTGYTGLAQREFELTFTRSRSTRTRGQLPPVFHQQSTSTYDGERYGGGRFATFHVRPSTRRRAPLTSAFPVDALSDEQDDYTSPPLPAADAPPPPPRSRHQRTPPLSQPSPPFHSVPMVRSESVPVLTYAELERVGGTRGWASARASLPTAEVPMASESAPTSPTSPQSAAGAAAAAAAAASAISYPRHTRTWPRRAYTAFSDPFAVPHEHEDYYGRAGAAAAMRSWTRPRSARRARPDLPLAALWSPTAASSAPSVSTSASSLPRTPPRAASPSGYPYGSDAEGASDGGGDIELQVEVDDADAELDLDIVMDSDPNADADADGDDTDRDCASPATSCGLSPMLRSAALGISSSAGHSPALPGSAALGVALSLSSSWSSSLTATPYGDAHPWRQAA